jgi:magnesium-transporting ATPase (P-type)
MSVVVKDSRTGEGFVFVKGAPEKLHDASIVQYPGFRQSIRELSLEGLRSIAVSWKRVSIDKALRFSREECLEGTSLLAVVTFANALKSAAKQTIATLQNADIATKMVTGDSIFVAIQTALTLEMVPLGQRIIALEGARLRLDGGLSAVAVRKDGAKIVE